MTDRAEFIGGSDIAAILGISPWRTAWDVYLEKTRDPSWQPQEETLLMRVGTYMETFLADEYEREPGHGIVGDRQMEHIHPDYPFLRVHVDGWIHRFVDETVVEEGIWEAKTASSTRDWGTVEEPKVPEHYQAQCFFALGLTGAKWCDVSVLLPRGDFRNIRLDADPALQANIIAAAVRFHDENIVKRIPPPMDASPAAGRWLARMPDDDEDVLEAGAELEEVVDKLSTVRTALDGLNSSKVLLENQAKALIGEHQKVVGRGWHITYKRNRPFPVTKWKEAAGEMKSMLQLAGMSDSADEAMARWTEIEENRRPLVLRKETED